MECLKHISVKYSVFILYQLGPGNSSVSIVTRLRAGRPKDRSLTAGRSTNFSLFLAVQAGSRTHPVSRSVGAGGKAAGT
jgi:hypothetical protein